MASSQVLSISTEGNSTTFLSNLFQCLTSLTVKRNVFLCSDGISCVLNHDCSLLSYQQALLAPSPLCPPIKYLHTLRRSLLNHPGSLRLTSYERCSGPLITLVALCWTCSSMSMSFFSCGAQNCTKYLILWLYQYWAERKGHLPWHAGSALPNHWII